MNIVCDRCSARFSVADEKIGDRTWKARCRRCGHRLLVRRKAAQGERPAAPPAKAGGSGDPLAIWFVVIGQEQVGPMTGAELRHRFSAGEILPSFYVWCEGYEGWLPIEVAPGLEDLLVPIDQSGPPTRRVNAQDRSQGRPSAAEEDSGSDSEAYDTVVRPMSPEALVRAGGGGHAEKTQRVSLDDVVAMYPAEAEPLLEDEAPPSNGSTNKTKPGKGSTRQLKGQRSEHSVLFRIGSDDDEDEGEAPADASPRPGEVAPGQEGTGLIDVRAMARTELERAGTEVTDKLVVSAPTMLSTPVVAPAGQTGLPRWIWGVMAGVVIGVGLLAALFTALLLRGR